MVRLRACIICQLVLKVQEFLVELIVKNLLFMKFQSSLEASMVTKWQYMKFQNLLVKKVQKVTLLLMKSQNLQVVSMVTKQL